MNGRAASMPTAPGGATAPRGLEHRIARLLSLGAAASVLLLAAGTLGFVAAGVAPLTPDWPKLDLARLPADLVALRPQALLWAGLMTAIATPLLRVGASLLGFLLAGERRMAAIATGVLAIIALAIVVAAPWGG